MGSGVSRTETGSFKGTGSQLDITKVGFRPSVVEILNTDGLVTGKWTDSMADGSMLKTINTDLLQMAEVTGGNGITPLAGGFRLGADTDLNVSGEVCHYIAHE